MIVTAVSAYTKTKYKIYIDGEFAFLLYKGEMSRFGIAEGKELDDKTVQMIREELILKRAKRRALHLLGDMDRTEEALRDCLKRGLYPEDIVDETIRYVRSFGYINDDRYAENYIRSRQGRKSRKEITAELLKKGISSEQIERAFEACPEADAEQDAVRRILRKKGFDPEQADPVQLQKIYAYLGRKGFRFDTVRQVIQNYNVDA